MIAVVTGASGFIGTNLVDTLVTDGVEVRVLRRPGVVYAPVPQGTTAHTVDLSADGAERAAVWQGVTHVFHLAARTRAARADSFLADNVRPTAALAALLGRLPSVPRLVYVSSQAAAGPASAADRPLTEVDDARPVEAYGRSKRDAEAAVRAHARELPAVIVRPSSVYGPHDRDFLQVFRQMQQPVAMQAVPPWHRLSLTHVNDLVAALRLAAVRDEAVGQTFFVEDGAPASWGDVYTEVGAALHRSPMRLTVPHLALQAAAAAAEVAARVRGTEPLLTRAKLALAQQPFWLCDASAARIALGWRPAIARVDGWASTCAWYREVRWLRS